MPGAGFQRYAAEARQLTKEMQEVPVNFVKLNMRDGIDSTSVVAKLLAANRCDEVAIQSVAGTAYLELTLPSRLLLHFVLLWLSTPTFRRGPKPRSTLSSVLIDSQNSRIALHCLTLKLCIGEVMRWRPATPLGVAHASTEDDVYDGYFIPKGTTVIVNIWAMTRDESIYHESDRFNPDRFFTADGKLNEDATILAFGFGRRICAGRHYADETIWATIVSVLSTFKITKAKDAAGKEIDNDPKYSDGLISHPEPFACSITPRSEMAKTLVQATAETHDV
ncbi:O-methylsterigmatocystin oxidoreductase [Mycena sanguinolenta]|uniref:O-methylsterigmatocystin oxidoreductase n=1 Tax=Mycena sanguinolenta TaxID=230812 RepID=A0A8H6YFX8_9AGAR|nr:O-methylsterigmatocystin oxidoreductase [Mycena sanguinolenta]